jgi:cytochrome oxidase Cu insertion factor (SCO1/SenC/PrrC family)
MIALASVPALLAVVPAGTQAQARPAPAAQTGLEIGARAPSFTLQDQEGRERSLSEFLTKGKLALVFYRSADW